MVKYEVGQLFEVFDNTCRHWFEIGEIVRLKTLDEDGDIESCQDLNGYDFWFVDSDDVRPVSNS